MIITRCEARPATEYAQEAGERVSWWRRVFGGRVMGWRLSP
jgi:hypothetical protein